MPATDDEVMVVEDLLKDDKNEVSFAVEGRQPVDTSKITPLENAHYDSSGGWKLIFFHFPFSYPSYFDDLLIMVFSVFATLSLAFYLFIYYYFLFRLLFN